MKRQNKTSSSMQEQKSVERREKKTAEPSTAMPNNNSERVGCTDMNDM